MSLSNGKNLSGAVNQQERLVNFIEEKSSTLDVGNFRTLESCPRRVREE
jgi:hypothetical protein